MGSKRIIFGVLGLVCLGMFVQRSCATEFTIGGSKGWTVPTDNTEPHYNQWAEKTRFQIGDSLVFVYPAGKDSVFLVSQEDYVSCNVDNPQKKFDDGHTVFTFEHSGAHHFVSGNRENCLKNEKVVVVVLADRSGSTSSGSPPPPPSPPPAPVGSPPPSPTPSTPEGPAESNPTPTPISEPSPPPPSPSAASSSRAYMMMSFLGCIGVLVASSFALAF